MIRLKIGRRPLIRGGRIGKDCCIFIDQSKRFTLKDGRLLEGQNNSWASLSLTCIRIEMHVM
jgi:hypothetical protein